MHRKKRNDFCVPLSLRVYYSDEEKGRIEDVVLSCIRCGEYRVLENILGRILERRKLIDWKVHIRVQI